MYVNVLACTYKLLVSLSTVSLDVSTDFSGVIGVSLKSQLQSIREQWEMVNTRNDIHFRHLSRWYDGIDRSEGKWGNAQEVMDTLWEWIRWFLLEVMTKEYEEL